MLLFLDTYQCPILDCLQIVLWRAKNPILSVQRITVLFDCYAFCGFDIIHEKLIQTTDKNIHIFVLCHRKSRVIEK